MSGLGLASPVGPLHLISGAKGIEALRWEEGPKQTNDATLIHAAEALARYFETGRLPCDVSLVLPQGFAGRFARALLAIPDGQTRTYGALAKDLNVSAQAIGQACGANRIPILVPCHRVLGADGLGGYSGHGGAETKVALLRLERAGGFLI